MTLLIKARALAGRHVLCVLAAGAGLGGGLVQAADSRLLLDEAIERALAEAPQLTASRAYVEAASQSAASAGRLPDPELIVGVDNLPVTTADRFSLNRDFMTMRKVGVMQSVPSRASRRVQSELAHQEVSLAEAQLRAQQFEIALSAAQAWINHAVARQSLQRLRALRGDLAIQSGAARAALLGGRSGATEAIVSESVLAGLEARIFDFEQQAAVARAELGRWVGEVPAEVPPELPWRQQFDQPETSTIDVLGDAPLAPTEPEVALARSRVALARAGKRPDWSTELSYANRGPGYSDMVSLQFRVALPMFSRTRQDPEIAARLAEARGREAAREEAIREHHAHVQAAMAVRNSGQTRLAHYESVLLPLAEDRMRVATASYGAGQGELREVLEALDSQADLSLQFTQRAGEVTRAGVYLQLLGTHGDSQ
ncbi:MAG TPA: TolC family protein [Steroidobacteraceae bacterium]|nr:TolC family protein [Steroidobacteraceae bacterium]